MAQSGEISSAERSLNSIEELIKAAEDDRVEKVK